MYNVYTSFHYKKCSIHTLLKKHQNLLLLLNCISTLKYILYYSLLIYANIYESKLLKCVQDLASIKFAFTFLVTYYTILKP